MNEKQHRSIQRAPKTERYEDGKAGMNLSDKQHETPARDT